MLKVIQTIEWIENNLHQKLNKSLLEKKTGYTSRHLLALFKKYINISVASYIRKRRLTLASVLLRETSRSVTEISLMYQFEHLQTFSRAFKKQFGLSPQQYRKALFWDMTYYYPSAIVRPFDCEINNVNINKNIYFSQELRRSYKVNFGYDFYIKTKNGKIHSYPNIYQDVIALIFKNNLQQPFIVFGELLPGEKCDTIIDMYLGHIVPNINQWGLIQIPKGNYLCFTLTGSPYDIMCFYTWVKGHGMHHFKKTLKRGPSFTIFNETDIKGKYKAKYYIPCINQLNSAMHE
ncbi:helix-turn-helix domain-containing protein [Salmonella enterica subsp. enterica serovar Rubislaw]|nr:helix-turn-helix domain-containing protein [Salmonella enterica]ELE3222536.1 helix-turn-helix domain-containing protein [Salmonella enterica subsp. enterica serovar Rubislaw]ELO3942393.1 helix-turn-helix domain-containing protein [Salmonella enterica]ELU8881647.1 helix-turn-helix domain-containing protein [Salmonella enterica]